MAIIFRNIAHLHVVLLFFIFFSACSSAPPPQVDLSGKWKFHAGDTSEWRLPHFDDSVWPTIRIPGDLVTPLGDHGAAIAWLRTTYNIEKPLSSPQSLLLGIVGDNEEVYIDGVLIGKTGEFPPHLKLGFHKYRSYLLPAFTLKPGTHTLAVRVFKLGGPGMGIVGTSPGIVEYHHASNEAHFYQVIRSDIPFALAVFIFCMGCYLMLIYLTCTVERQYLYSAGACLFLTLYCIGDCWKMSDAFNMPPKHLNIGFAMTSGTAVGYFLFRFIRSATRKPISRMDRIVFWWCLVLALIFPFARDLTELNVVIGLWMPVVLFTNTYIGVQLYRNLKAKQKISSIFLWSFFMVLMACFSHDLYATLFKPYLPSWVSYGFFAFCLGISLFLAQDYSGALVDRSVTKKLLQKSEDLEKAISKDPLTGLYSRESFMQKIDSEIVQARSQGLSLSLAILDVDHFKYYNDTYGHPAGDQLLTSLGWIMQKWTRTTDYCGRLGGEEFGIILGKTSLADSYRACERLRQNIITFPFQNMGKNNQHITVSIGLVTLSDQFPTKEKMYEEADRQLYAAKKIRNQIEPAIFPIAKMQKHPGITDENRRVAI